jgi:hypothetical protein
LVTYKKPEGRLGLGGGLGGGEGDVPKMGGGLGGLLNSMNHLWVRSSARRSQRVVCERKYTEVHTRSSAFRTKDMTSLWLYLTGGPGGGDG